MQPTRAFLLVAALSGATTASFGQVTGDPHAGMSMPEMENSADGTALLTGALGTQSAGGRATIKGTLLTITWSGDQPQASRPSYLHKGTCQHDEGSVGAAIPIAVGADGKGTGRATLDAPLAAGTSYFIAVHAAGGDADTPVIACGPVGRNDTSAMAGMQMTAMDAMAGMVGMPGMAGMPGMPGMPGMSADSGRGMHGMSGGVEMQGEMSPAMMQMHMRMMSDPVIRQRIEGDTTLRRMMAEMTARMPDAKAAAKSTAKATKAGAKPAAKPAAKPTKKPAPKDPMAGMDMPGMKMPSTTKP